MSRCTNLFVITLLSAAALFASAAQAMTIVQYDKMSNEDQSEYISRLVGGAERAYKDEGRPDLAAQVDHLFTTSLPGDQITIGVGEFQLNLGRARVTDEKNVEKDPSAHRLEVEDAMLVTLKKNNIPLSEDFIGAFRAINKDFQPKPPPQAPPTLSPPQ